MEPSAASGSASSLDVRVDGPAGTIVLRNPGRCNALSRELVQRLREALRDLHQQPKVRAIVLTGAGSTFSSGSDLAEIRASQRAEDSHAQWFADVSGLRELFLNMLRFPKPIIAAVNGPALGTGLGLVAACDLVIASPESTFGFPEARRGLTAGIAIPLLSFRLGASHTAALLFCGRAVAAQEAYRVGLVHEIAPYDLLWARACEMAGEIAQLAQEAVALSKRVLNETVGERLATELSAAAAATATARTTEAAVEGVAAFLEKRSPDWLRADDRTNRSRG